jgi:DeoR/GlpR family transcriptional regulator of sugar metabolism
VAALHSERPVFAEERRARIAGMVSAAGRVTLAELVESLAVTEQTIRKDLDELQARHLLRRTHGGAIAVQASRELTVADRSRRHREAKQSIATACLAHITSGASIFLDSGTTVQGIAQGLHEVDVNVLTNALGVATMLADRAMIRHTLLGGQIRPLGGSLIGPVALETLNRFSVDIAFIGATGMTGDGITVADVAEAQIKQAVIDRARLVILAMDSSKFGVTDFVRVCGLDRIDILVTECTTADVQRWCEQADVRLQVAADTGAPA